MSAAQSETLTRTRFADIAGWRNADLAPALVAFRRSCAEILAEGRAFRRKPRFAGHRDDWLPACEAAGTSGDARRFFERHFLPFTVSDAARPQGLFTGYYEPEAAGSLEPSPAYPAAVLAKPDDLVAFQPPAGDLAYGRLIDGEKRGYFSRREIEEGALAGRGLELVWLESWVDLFFIHIQGSGRVRLPDGRVIRLAYAAKNGLPYTAIGHVLVSRGEIAREAMSMQTLRSWMAAHPGEARELMWENASYIFFRHVAVDDPALGPPGAQTVNLTPRVSLAVDRSLWAYGMPVWLDTTAPMGEPPRARDFRTLMIAQDTGSAIRGALRGDVFWGAGPEAAGIAGRMQSEGAMTVLLPLALAQMLGD